MHTGISLRKLANEMIYSILSVLSGMLFFFLDVEKKKKRTHSIAWYGNANAKRFKATSSFSHCTRKRDDVGNSFNIMCTFGTSIFLNVSTLSQKMSIALHV